jgi:hypothetical protein
VTYHKSPSPVDSSTPDAGGFTGDIDAFLGGVLNGTGWREVHVRNHGHVCERVRRAAAEEDADG